MRGRYRLHIQESRTMLVRQVCEAFLCTKIDQLEMTLPLPCSEFNLSARYALPPDLLGGDDSAIHGTDGRFMAA